MPYIRYIFPVLLFIVALPVYAQSITFVSGIGAEVSIVRNGIPVQVRDEDRQDIAVRVADVFNSRVSDTTQTWFRQKMEMQNISPADKWVEIKNKSHIAVRFKEKEDSPTFDSDIQEVIQGINENPSDGFFGITLAQLRNGEIHLYQVQGKEMINLYCLDKTEKYLPDHYSSLREKYDTEEYAKVGMSCSAADGMNQ